MRVVMRGGWLVMQALSLNEQRELLQIARTAIQEHLLSESWSQGMAVAHLNKLTGGCFVTLRIYGSLRGCIGTFQSDGNLIQAIQRMAVAAAFEDPRFEPLSFEELPEIKIEISILGPLQKLGHIRDLEIGRHGILVRHQGKSGTYLPDVAVEQGWDGEQFVRHCALHKAGIAEKDLPAAELFSYEVTKISE